MLVLVLGNALLQALGDLSSLYYLLSFVLFIVYFAYAQKIQLYLALNDVGKSVNKLKLMSEKARKDTIDYFVNSGKPAGDPSQRIDQFLDYVTIMPVDIDPNGIVNKLEHIVTTRDERVRAEVRQILPELDPVRISIAENVLEAASALNFMHKIVRHFYLMGKKTNSYIFIFQLQMLMPLILQEADAFLNAMDTFKLAQPIGDGIGPIVAATYMAGLPKQTVAKDTIMSVAEYKGRTLYVLKAEGPMGYVGEPGIGMQRLVEEMGIQPNAIIMVDAALKLEGEKSGEVAEGVGAAIGGIGVDKFKIEELAAKHKIPLYAVLVKQSILEAITVMRKDIAEASDKVLNVVSRVIEEKTKEGDKVLLAGIGNTLGVAQ
jgi:hypothetical protein